MADVANNFMNDVDIVHTNKDTRQHRLYFSENVNSALYRRNVCLPVALTVFETFQTVSTYKLLYFNIKGKGQLVRLLLHDQGIAFADDVVAVGDWPSVKPTMPFGQVPSFWDGDLHLVQTGAILRYLSRRHGTYGSNDTEASLIDMAYDGVEDFYMFYVRMIYGDYENCIDKYLAETLPNVVLPTLQKLLMKNKNGEGFLVGDKVSFADYNLFQFLDSLLSLSKSHCLDAFPVMKAYYDRIKARPGINAFLSSDLNQQRTFNNIIH